MQKVNISAKTIISPEEVLFFEGDVNYTRIHYFNRTEMVAITLKSIETSLKQFPFYRIHRKYFINLEQIQNQILNDCVQLRNNQSLVISKRKVGDFNKIMKSNRIVN
jgi:two-component system, LytTR family, response regulator